MLAVLARYQISPADSQHGCGLVEINFTGSGGWCCGVTVIDHTAQGEALSGRNEGCSLDRVIEIGQKAWADVKVSAKWKNINVAFHGFEIQVAVIGDAVFAEVAAITEHVEAGAEVHNPHHWGCDLSADPQSRHLYRDSNGVKF